ncbi:beta-ketoacyl synthase N-terminal-like domain-containing protein [Streptomyces sp. NPDC004609]|uniref:beta-ketoacyl synthase N-terminal-like domain-containing protein n=1 Tax=Streptomyces sp. NPDC004609 TaxID=3364704 RepID=UPI0036B7EB12
MSGGWGRGLLVTGVGVVTPGGDAPGGGEPAPSGEPWFDHRARLGPRGYKYLPAAAQYALAAVRGAVADGGRPGRVAAERRGLVLATNGGLAKVFDAMDATIVERGAEAISPALAPYFAVNVLGNRLAAELELKGFALTVTAERTAALDALSVGARALANGRCGSLVLAATEDALPGGRAGEQGAVALTLEPGARASGEPGDPGAPDEPGEPGAPRQHGESGHHGDAEGPRARAQAVVRARSVFVPPGALETRRGRARADALLAGLLEGLGGPLTVRAQLDASAVSGAVRSAVSAVHGGVPEPAAGERHTGCLRPAVELARAVTEHGGDSLVVTATGAGHIALVHVTPHRTPHLTRESAC